MYSRSYRLFKVPELCLEWILDDSRLENNFIGTAIVDLVGLETGFKSMYSRSYRLFKIPERCQEWILDDS